MRSAQVEFGELWNKPGAMTEEGAVAWIRRIQREAYMAGAQAVADTVGRGIDSECAGAVAAAVASLKFPADDTGDAR
jgi:hypothetical protein